ncbi:MAG: pilus assembly protein [Deltaproteobacteria bacterium]|nr:pilus assembly protein [Deltaproteobacteria bacterium]
MKPGAAREETPRGAAPASRREKGAALVEFGLVLPLLLLILLGTIEFGLLLYNRQVLTNAAREGARFGIVAATPRVPAADIRDQVSAYCSDFLVSFAQPVPTPATTVTALDDETGAEITIGTAQFGDDLRVIVQYPYRFLVFPALADLLPGADPVFPGVLTIASEAVMKYE